MTRKWTAAIAVVVAAMASCSGEDEKASTPPSGAVTSPPPPASAEAGAVRESAPSVRPVALGECAGPPGKRLRTLVVGNSQIYFWNLPKILSDVSASAPAACPRIDAEGFTQGGQNLHHLWTHGDSLGRNLPAHIRDGRYDVIVIAESIDLVEPAKARGEFETYASAIIDAARAAGSQPVLYATPYPDQPERSAFVGMAVPQLALGHERSVPVAAGGLAWLRVWQVLPEIDLHHPDHAHPGFNGSYVSALVIYAVVTKATPVGLTGSPPIECYRGACAKPMTAHEVSVFQQAAWREARATGLR